MLDTAGMSPSRDLDPVGLLVIAGLRSGYFDTNQEQEIVQEINDSRAEILFVAMGSPRQELWIERHRRTLGVKVAMGVGGSFDVLASFHGAPAVSCVTRKPPSTA